MTMASPEKLLFVLCLVHTMINRSFRLSANSALRRDLPTMLQRPVFIDSAKILHRGSTHSKFTNHQLLCSLISTSGFGVSLPTIILVLLREYHCRCALRTRRFYCHCKDLLWITSYEMSLSKSATPGGLTVVPPRQSRASHHGVFDGVSLSTGS